MSSKTFSYYPPLDPQGSYNSITISNVDGLVTVQPWSQPTLLINGTITAKGLGSSLSTVTISNSTVNGNVVFKAVFPVTAGILFSQIYTVNMTVYVPSQIRFYSVQISNVNGGVQLGSINSTTVTLNTVNGNISLDCIYCRNVTTSSTNGNVAATFATLVNQGTYNLTATNANIVFTAPSSSSFRLDAKVLNGSIFCSLAGCPTSTVSGGGSLTWVFGNGSASVDLSSGNGQITLTGT